MRVCKRLGAGQGGTGKWKGKGEVLSEDSQRDEGRRGGSVLADISCERCLGGG